MNPTALIVSLAAIVFTGCSGYNQIPNKVQKLNISSGTTKPASIVAPQNNPAFAAYTAQQAQFVEKQLFDGTVAAFNQFGRFNQSASREVDATVVFDSIRHGVTRVSNGLYAPIVQATVRVVDPAGKQLARRFQSATSGEINTLDAFTKDAALYREGLRVAADKLALEIVSGL
jgi:hypothetical protein